MKTIVLTFFIFSLNILPLFCQLQKGDVVLGFHSSFSRQVDANHHPPFKHTTYYLSPAFGYMLSNKFMVGGQLDYSLTKGSSSRGEDYLYKSIGIGNYARYYFLDKNKFSPYLFAQTSFEHQQSEAEWMIVPNEEKWVFSAAAGFGANYFFAPNVAVQANIGTSIFQNEEFANYDDILFGNIGIQTFINDRTGFSQDLMINYLKRGNFVISGNGNFTIDDNPSIENETFSSLFAKPTFHSYYFNPQLKYFTSNTAAVVFGASMWGFGQGSHSQFILGINSGFEKYFPIGKRLYALTAATLTVERSRFSQYGRVFSQLDTLPVFAVDTIKQKITDIELIGDFDLALKYFSKRNSIWSIGANYVNSHFLKNSRDASTKKSFRIYMEYEHFFLKNLSIVLKSNLYTRGNSNTFILGTEDNLQSFNFKFGINYFIFNGKQKNNSD